MKAVRRNSDNRVAYLFEDYVTPSLSSSGLFGPGANRPDISDEHYTLVEHVTEPVIFVGGAMSWNGSEWNVIDTEAYDTARS